MKSWGTAKLGGAAAKLIAEAEQSDLSSYGNGRMRAGLIGKGDEMNGREKLKPCPFCGYDHITKASITGVYWHVKCPICIATTGEYRDEESAVRAWNKRADDELCTECATEAMHELDRLRAELHEWKQRAHEAERKLARYKRERTIEDVLAEFAPKWVDTYHPDDKAALVDTYADELRELMGSDA